ncbi:cation diffusion facilitator family transporter [uncultured Thermanaerothrix sp.]|uniref:cation diffusion facilitator family transporter n=1 Tax=uncultured Thermanaerothrix sp. TaxID=1195149 RepID=UPI002623365A|nr:cation diffusion facilitator family transporter [uncultured Thermanaerothrix sp.]
MHNHAIEHNSKKLFIALALTGLIFIAEFGGGLWTGSLALISDAAHVFMDAFALGLSYLALRAATLPADDRHTYGYHRMQVLAALANGATLLFISFEILKEALTRFQSPEPILAGPMLLIAVAGLGVNIVVALVLREHDPADLNTRAAFLHVLGDALASVGVIGAGIAIYLTGQLWIDPLVSVLISLLILFSSGRLLKETVHILAEGMPEGMTASAVAESMKSVAGVLEVHDLHIWTVSPGYVALSAHVVLENQTLAQTERIMRELKDKLDQQYEIEHTTIQFECANCGQGSVVCLQAQGAGTV